jgi:hypothetical protein
MIRANEMTLSPHGVGALRWNAVLRIARQEVRDTLLGWGVYVTMAAALLMAVLLVYNSVRFVGESGLSIIVRPFFTPLLVVASLTLLYVTVGATLAISRPREQGALQVLFFAPVDALALVGAHCLAGIAVYAFVLVWLVPLLLVLAALTNFVVPVALLWGILPTLLVAGMAVAFGLFVSAIASSGRTAVLLLIAATLLLLAVQAGYAALLNIPPTSRYYDALLYARVVLRNLNTLLLFLSPFRMLDQGLGAALRADWLTLVQNTTAATVGMAIWFGAAVWALRRRGVLA